MRGELYGFVKCGSIHIGKDKFTGTEMSLLWKYHMFSSATIESIIGLIVHIIRQFPCWLKINMDFFFTYSASFWELIVTKCYAKAVPHLQSTVDTQKVHALKVSLQVEQMDVIYSVIHIDLNQLPSKDTLIQYENQ